MAIKEHIQRLILTARKIDAMPYISIEQLSRTMEEEMVVRGYEPASSPNTVKRDIKELREDFYIEIKYCRKHGGYYIDKSEFGELNFESLFETFDMLYAMGVDGALPPFVYTEQPRPKGTKHLYAIIEAIKKWRQITFCYTKYSSDELSTRQLSPYALKECHGRWYVVGKEPLGEIRTFGLDRISSLTLLDLRAEESSDFSMEDRFQDSFGIYSDETYPIEDVILAFDAEDGRYIKSAPLHPSQQIIKDEDDEFIVKVRIRLTPDFVMEILSRSWSLRVIHPSALRQQICEIYKDAFCRNAPEMI